MGAMKEVKKMITRSNISVQAQLDQKMFKEAAVPDLSYRLDDKTVPRTNTKPSNKVEEELFGLLAGDSEGGVAWDGDTASLREVIEKIFSRTGKMSDLFDGIKVKDEGVKRSVRHKKNFISEVRDIAMEKMSIQEDSGGYQELEEELYKLGKFYGLPQVQNPDKGFRDGSGAMSGPQ